MAEQLSYYKKRVQKENKMRKFFTQTCNTGGLNELLRKHGLVMHADGTVKDNGACSQLLKSYLNDIVLPAIEKELGIKGIKVHDNPSPLTLNLFRWSKAEIVNPNEGE